MLRHVKAQIMMALTFAVAEAQARGWPEHDEPTGDGLFNMLFMAWVIWVIVQMGR